MRERRVIRLTYLKESKRMRTCRATDGRYPRDPASRLSQKPRPERARKGDRWSLQESVYLFVLALERWLELALAFAYQDVEPEERGADEGNERAQKE